MCQRFALAAACASVLLLSTCGEPYPASAAGLGLASTPQDAQLLAPGEAFAQTAAMPDPMTLDVHYTVAPGAALYRDRLEVRVTDREGTVLLYRASSLTPDNERLHTRPAWGEAIRLPPAQMRYEAALGQEMAVYGQSMTIRVPLRAGAAAPLTVRVSAQGCSAEGVCLPPAARTLTLEAADGGYTAHGPQVRRSVPPPEAERFIDEPTAWPAPQAALTSEAQPEAALHAAASPAGLGDTGIAAWIAGASFWQIVLASLLFGLALSLTPCVLPMVPILLAVVAPKGAGSSRARLVGLACAYVLGMAVTYTALGLASAAAGSGAMAILQSPPVIAGFSILLAVLALGQLGAFAFQVPVALQSSAQGLLARLPGGRASAAFAAGAGAALIVGPCVAAPLAGVLLFISQSGDVVAGGVALFAMAWGEGLLLIAVAAGAGALIPRAGAWMQGVKVGLAVLLLASAWFIARPLMSVSWHILGWASLALWVGLMFLCLGRPTKKREGFSSVGLAASRAVGLSLLFWALMQGLGVAAGGSDLQRPLAPFTASVPVSEKAIQASPTVKFTEVRSLPELQAKLKQAQRPVLLDFYANWCVSCREVDQALAAPQVAQRLAGFELLRIDLSKMTNEAREALARFRLFGPPALLVFTRETGLEPVARIVGAPGEGALLATLDKVLAHR